MAENEKKAAKGGASSTAEVEPVGAPIVVQEHKNIYEALSAFQGENPTIARTKEFGKEGDKMHWWYSPMDEVLKVVRPLLYKHGLSLTWTEGKNPCEMVAVLYHTTYECTTADEAREVKHFDSGSNVVSRIETFYGMVEKNVLRSMPIKIPREGDMKDIGGKSTYARRYTAAELLGIAPDEDNDIMEENERLTKVEGFAFNAAKTRVTGAKTEKVLEEQVTYFKKELKAIEDKKPTSLGFTKEQYDELMVLADARGKILRGEEEPVIDVTPPAAEPGQ